MEFKIETHGDWIEQQAASFITSSIPFYEDIWKRFIGHQGNGKMADMVKIEEADDSIRRNFAQHHYTVLESLYFMKLIVADVSQTNAVDSFESYRKTINQVMTFQAYSGRLRDNMGKCFLIMVNSDKAEEVHKRLDAFYHQRHVFIHGRKVPFTIDSDKLFQIPEIKKATIDPIGYGSDMLWEAAQGIKVLYLEDSLKNSLVELTSEVNNLLADLLGHVKQFMQKKNLQIKNPSLTFYPKAAISGSTASSSTINPNIAASGSV